MKKTKDSIIDALTINQKEFNKTIIKFHTLEDARDQLWDRAQNLIDKGFELEAYILILATWNFARFRYFMKKFDLENFKTVINKVNPRFIKLQGIKFEDIDFTNKALKANIGFIYSQLKQIAEQTGASKIMALKNSGLFIMWDTEIRRMYGIKKKCEAEDYITFLTKMRETFGNINWNERHKSFAKVIDEYNYVKADETRKKRKINTNTTMKHRASSKIQDKK
jgi:hypothetical protein